MVRCSNYERPPQADKDQTTDKIIHTCELNCHVPQSMYTRDVLQFNTFTLEYYSKP